MNHTQTIGKILCAVLVLLGAEQTRAADWTYYASTPTRDAYYDRDWLEKVGKEIVRIQAKAVFRDEGKQEAFIYLQGIGKQPADPGQLDHVIGVHEIDCSRGKIRDLAMQIRARDGQVLYASTSERNGPWYDILAQSVGEMLKDLVCRQAFAPAEAVADEPEVVEPPADTPLPAASAPAKDEKAFAPEEAVHLVVARWVGGWQSGDLAAYRACYAADFTSKGMDLAAWVAHKTDLARRSKNIRIRIDRLQITVDGDRAEARFIQDYSSSLLKDTGEKRLVFKRIDGAWKITQELMAPSTPAKPR